MIMRLVSYNDNPAIWAVLYTDGTMAKFDSKETPANAALTDILSRYHSFQMLHASDSDLKWSDTDSNMATWGGDAVKTLAYVTDFNFNDGEGDLILKVLDPEPVRVWMGNAENTKMVEAKQENYITLQEYCEEINRARKEQGLKEIQYNSVRTRVARHQLPGCRKFGAIWMVPSGTPWPADRRRKSADSTTEK